MHAFVCDEGLARFCTEKYAAPTKENFRNEYMHLTNYSINKASPNYIWEPANILKPNEGSKRTLTALFE
jgi:tubulin polyglutamylase TTLL11